MYAEEKLIADCIAGKSHAQSLLYRKHAPVMLGICMRYANSRAEAEDVLQDGFVKVFMNLKHFKFQGSFEGWVRRIMVNTAINSYHRHIRDKLLDPIDEVKEVNLIASGDDDESFFPEPDESAVDPEKLMALIQQLPGGYKMVLNLYVFEGYSHKEISDMLGITENTSKSQLFKARRHLRNLLAQLRNEKPLVLHSYERR